MGGGTPPLSSCPCLSGPCKEEEEEGRSESESAGREQRKRSRLLLLCLLLPPFPRPLLPPPRPPPSRPPPCWAPSPTLPWHSARRPERRRWPRTTGRGTRGTWPRRRRLWAATPVGRPRRARGSSGPLSLRCRAARRRRRRVRVMQTPLLLLLLLLVVVVVLMLLLLMLLRMLRMWPLFLLLRRRRRRRRRRPFSCRRRSCGRGCGGASGLGASAKGSTGLREGAPSPRAAPWRARSW